jgi:hypothetical protein
MRTRHAILLTTAVLIGASTAAAPAIGARSQEEPPKPRPSELWEQYPLNPASPPVSQAPAPAASEPATSPPPSPRPLPLPPGVVEESISPPVADGPKELPPVVNALLLAAALLILLAVVTPLRHVLVGASTGRGRRSPLWRAQSFGGAASRPAGPGSFPSVADRIADYGQGRGPTSPSVETHPNGPTRPMVWSTPPPQAPHLLPRLRRRQWLGPALLWALGVFVTLVVGLLVGGFL